MHALLYIFNCTNIIIKSLRDQFLTIIISISNQFSSLSNKVKLLYIMSSHDNDTLVPVICEWIRKINEQYVIPPSHRGGVLTARLPGDGKWVQSQGRYWRGINVVETW